MRSHFVFVLIMAACAVPCRAQGTATIVGRVLDPSSAVVPGAKVTAQEAKTGLSRTTVTAAGGNYAIPLLRPAEYEITIEAAGFRRWVQSGLRLEAEQRGQRGTGGAARRGTATSAFC